MMATVDFQREEPPADIQTLHFGLELGSEGAGGEKRCRQSLCPQPLCPGASGPVPALLPSPCPDRLHGSSGAFSGHPGFSPGQCEVQGSDKFSGRHGTRWGLPETEVALRAQGQLGHVDFSARGKGLGEEKSIGWKDRASSLMKCIWLRLPAWNWRKRRRNQGKELEKEGGEEAGEK